MKDIPCEKLARNWRSRTMLCTTPFTEQSKLSLTRMERVRGPRNRHLTSPQLAASLNSTHKTPVSTWTVKRWLRDVGLLGSYKEKAISQTGQWIEKIKMGKKNTDTELHPEVASHCWRWDWLFAGYIHTYTHIYTYTQIQYTDIYTHTYIHTHIHTHVYIHTYIYTHTQIYTHIDIHT